jgi:hypothetical protein
MIARWKEDELYLELELPPRRNLQEFAPTKSEAEVARKDSKGMDAKTVIELLSVLSS